MTYLKNFFLICSGANHSVLKRTPTEIDRYVGIGATIFFTGLFAAIASAYALHTVFNNYVVSALFGLLWGLMIFNLDRYIVSTIKKKGSFFRDFSSVFPRLILAILIAIVIAKPLELKIFESEINSELQLMQQENYKEQEDLVDARFDGEIPVIQENIARLKNEINEKAIIRDQLDNEAILEADGTGGSLQRNMGPIYAIKKEDALKAQTELDQISQTNNSLILQEQQRIDQILSNKDAELASLDKVVLGGFAARIEAMDRLSNKSSAIFYAGIFIMLLFIAIETAPIFVKMIAERSPYDYVLNKHEFSFEMNHKAYVEALAGKTNNKVNFENKTGVYKTQLAIEAEKEISKQALSDRLEELKGEPLSWKELLKKGKLFEV